ncbi:hypothetical protein Bhyg_01892, partial [Pseudolycoriella hygida]
ITPLYVPVSLERNHPAALAKQNMKFFIVLTVLIVGLANVHPSNGQIKSSKWIIVFGDLNNE